MVKGDTMDRDEALEVYWKEARYSPIDGKDSYMVRVGDKVLRHKDTQKLFEMWLKAHKIKSPTSL
jgi:predicted HTH transcriptional regulator